MGLPRHLYDRWRAEARDTLQPKPKARLTSRQANHLLDLVEEARQTARLYAWRETREDRAADANAWRAVILAVWALAEDE